MFWQIMQDHYGLFKVGRSTSTRSPSLVKACEKHLQYRYNESSIWLNSHLINHSSDGNEISKVYEFRDVFVVFVRMKNTSVQR